MTPTRTPSATPLSSNAVSAYTPVTMSSDDLQTPKPPLDLAWLSALEIEFPPDATELDIPDVATAAALMRERRFDLFAVMSEVGESYLQAFGDGFASRLRQVQDALALSFTRMASRHGSWGSDLHHYHNEGHALELLNGRLARIRLQLGWSVLEPEDWLCLALFATCHDLRQREAPSWLRGVGANERASIAESARILDACGFDRVRDRNYYESIGWMIAGSTFDARPTVGGRFNSADDAASGGCLAPKLVAKIKAELGDAPETPELRHRFDLMLLAADIDTANVGEPFLALVGSAVRLALESQMRAGRAIDSTEAAQPVFDFLTTGQERYFYELHRFVSDIGERVFGPGKAANSERVQQQGDRMRQRYGGGVASGLTGQNLIDAFVASASELA
jgi:hypothetical protein